MREHDPDALPWALKGKGDGEFKRHTSIMYYMADYDQYLIEKYRRIEENEQRWESAQVEDAELVLVAYGISSRICEEAVDICRSRGQKVGLIRPISLYPFPVKAFEKVVPPAGFLCVEMTLLAQMAFDVRSACGLKRPVYSLGGGTVFYDVKNVCAMVDEVFADRAQEVRGV